MEQPKFFRAWMIWIIIIPLVSSLIVLLSFAIASNESEAFDAVILMLIFGAITFIAEVLLIPVFIAAIFVYRNERIKYKNYLSDEETKIF